MQYTEDSLYLEFQKNARKYLVPTGGGFELTPRCTLDCAMCYVHMTNEQMIGRHELTGDEWIKIIDDAYAAGMLSALVTGGECMLHKDFRRIYLHLKSLSVFVSINTNGTLITDEYVEFFRKNPPRQMQITMYGSDDDHYEKVTGHRVYKRVKESILKLRDAGINLCIAITPSKYLIDDVLNIVEFAKRERIFYLVNPALMQANDDTGRDIEDYGLTPEQSIEIKRRVREFEGKEFWKNEYIPDIPCRIECDEPARRLPCGAGRSTFTISWDGTMRPCAWVSDVTANVLEVGFDAAWKTINKGVAEHIVPIECESCEYRPACVNCAIMRSDPNDPMHRNPNTCRETIGYINSGTIKFARKSALEKETT